jgi:signal transduction histidine kinase
MRGPFGTAVDSLGLPRSTVAIFGAVPLGIAVVVAINFLPSAWWPLTFLLLGVAVASTVGDVFFPDAPEVVIGLTGIGALAPVIAVGGDRLSLVIAWVVVFRSSAFGSRAESLTVLAAALGLTCLAGATAPGLPGIAFVLPGMVVAWLAGTAARQIVLMVRHMRETEQLLAEEAARDERRKLAREVHDVIAHSMTVTLLHLNGARLALRKEPEVAESALQRAERVGRASLEDLRRTVRLLSETTDPTLGTSVDLRDDLERLQEGFAGGAQMTLKVEGDAEAVPPYVALTVFRIVQESLTNAVRHAPGSNVEILVEVDDKQIALRVENSMGEQIVTSGGGSGRGLHGMFERAAVLGGHVEAGPTKEGWVVTGWVPRDVPPAGVEA